MNYIISEQMNILIEIRSYYFYTFTSKYFYFTKVNSTYFIYFTYLLFEKSKVNVPPLFSTIFVDALAINVIFF